MRCRQSKGGYTSRDVTAVGSLYVPDINAWFIMEAFDAIIHFTSIAQEDSVTSWHVSEAKRTEPTMGWSIFYMHYKV